MNENDLCPHCFVGLLEKHTYTSGALGVFSELRCLNCDHKFAILPSPNKEESEIK